MEILSCGSFINLDNREKIEQLKITAYELAKTASETEGFVNSPESNRRLALEIWQGAEYMCRNHEEAIIKNIFLSNFLERLHEIGRDKPIPDQVSEPTTPVYSPTPSIDIETASPTNSLDSVLARQTTAPKDEYLGVVAPNEIKASARVRSDSDECVPEIDEHIGALVDSLAEAEEAASTRPQNLVSREIEMPGLVSAENSQAEVPSTEQESEQVPEEPIESIVLQEKEPYNFDSCTVTAVIQLLPESTGVRKCVISVRTHDFAPQVIIADVSAGKLFQDICGALDEAFGQYRTDLPVKAAEKVKKEKPANKKRSVKSTDSSKPNKPAISADKANDVAARGETPAVPSVQNSNFEKDQQNLFAS